MYASGWGLTETPGTLNSRLRAAGGFVNQAIIWSAITRLYPQIRCTGLTLCDNSAAPTSDINATLADGQPVIVEVDFSPAPGLQTHWVLLYKRLADDYLMLDPWPYPPETSEATLLFAVWSRQDTAARHPGCRLVPIQHRRTCSGTRPS